MQQLDMYRFISYIEDAALFMAKKPKKSTKYQFVKMLGMETFSLEVSLLLSFLKIIEAFFKF